MRVVAAVAVAALLVGLAPPASAAQPQSQGWWWMLQQSDPGNPGALPPPAFVPPDGLYVANDLGGPQAMAAVRFLPASGFRPSTLTLRVAQVVGAPVIQACPLQARWVPVQGGRWEQRPLPDCSSGAAVGTLHEQQAVVTFDVSTLSRRGVLDVGIIPGPSATSGSSVFQIAFARPDSRSITVAATDASSTAGPGTAPTTTRGTTASSRGPAGTAAPGTTGSTATTFGEVAAPAVFGSRTNRPRPAPTRDPSAARIQIIAVGGVLVLLLVGTFVRLELGLRDRPGRIM